MEDRVDKTKEEWKNELTPEQFHVCHRFGNEGDFGRPERFSESFAIDSVQVE